MGSHDLSSAFCESHHQLEHADRLLKRRAKNQDTKLAPEGLFLLTRDSGSQELRSVLSSHQDPGTDVYTSQSPHFCSIALISDSSTVQNLSPSGWGGL